jgi:hypothetical protein
MKAISIKQPWASFVIEGIKDIENRNWFTYHRGLLYIHTGKGFDLQGAKLVSELYPEYKEIIEQSKYIRGGIIGHVHMIDCVTNHNSPWFHGEYGFVLTSPKKMAYHEMKGQLGLFNFEFNGLNTNQRKEIQLSLF